MRSLSSGVQMSQFLLLEFFFLSCLSYARRQFDKIRDGPVVSLHFNLTRTVHRRGLTALQGEKVQFRLHVSASNKINYFQFCNVLIVYEFAIPSVERNVLELAAALLVHDSRKIVQENKC